LALEQRKKARVAIMAHNEEGNIVHLLERVCGEKPPGIDIDRIVVVSSGSTDRTNDLVQGFVEKDPRVQLIVQEERHGKCAAINLFLADCPRSCFVVLLSGDILPEPGAVTALLLPLLRPRIGMTGGRPVPINDRNTFFGFACHLIWDVHHEVALKSPKLGEAVAFKKVVDSIPEDLAVDEAALEALIRDRGLRLKYCPDAVIRNRGPDNLKDFLKQRRRIQVGHVDLRNRYNYKVSTYGLGTALGGLLSVIQWRPRFLAWTFLTCLLVLFGRILGLVDCYLLRKRHAVWDIAQSTKGTLTRR
jgi:cellulose synthase/poly-beta-1,6-N-acetylglucosamine synthase-like glycosyltransferase